MSAAAGQSSRVVFNVCLLSLALSLSPSSAAVSVSLPVFNYSKLNELFTVLICWGAKWPGDTDAVSLLESNIISKFPSIQVKYARNTLQ